jgi:hypothetical protein
MNKPEMMYIHCKHCNSKRPSLAVGLIPPTAPGQEWLRLQIWCENCDLPVGDPLWVQPADVEPTKEVRGH